jgi:hypothetical protein
MLDILAAPRLVYQVLTTFGKDGVGANSITAPPA